MEINNLWVLDEAPSKPLGPEESVDRQIGLLPPKNGSVFRVIKFPPEKDWIDNVDPDAAKASFASIGAEGASDQDAPPHPLMHRPKPSISPCVCRAKSTSSSTIRSLDEARRTCVQRGTNHAWSNRSDQDCYMMFVLWTARSSKKHRHPEPETPVYARKTYRKDAIAMAGGQPERVTKFVFKIEFLSLSTIRFNLEKTSSVSQRNPQKRADCDQSVFHACVKYLKLRMLIIAWIAVMDSPAQVKHRILG